MSLTANAVAWAPRSNRWPALALKAIAIACVSLIASQYLAGFLLLAWCRQDLRTAGPLTIARYAYYYGGGTDDDYYAQYYGDRPVSRRTTCGLQPGATYLGPDGRWYPC